MTLTFADVGVLSAVAAATSAGFTFLMRLGDRLWGAKEKGARVDKECAHCIELRAALTSLVEAQREMSHSQAAMEKAVAVLAATVQSAIGAAEVRQRELLSGIGDIKMRLQ